MTRDGHIRLLPLHVANKIAAGEVVERPASVVKELVENAIDAGATRIDVAVTAGGRKLVSVRDNGCGMARDDALLSLERQATSKIRDVDDIERIDTLGFRGEAIPSIAAVSRFTLLTRRADADAGTQIVVNAGDVAEVRDAGCPPGTLVEVRDLFCNVPARRKFLRAYQTEEAHIRTVFTLHALAHPGIGFSLALDGREIYRFAPGATLEERTRDLFGPEFVGEIVPARARHAEVSVSGYVERPNRNAPAVRHDQFVFINGRPATAPVIAYALREAYPRLDGDMRPAVILFIELNPGLVDVNVHPTKREVRFRRPADVRDALIEAITNAFAGGMVPAASHAGGAAPGEHEGNTAAPEPAAAPAQATAAARAAPVVPQPAETPAAGPAPFLAAAFPPPKIPAARLPLVTATAPDAPTTRPWKWFRYLAETESGYLLIETDTGLVTVNPRAARERIVFEALLAADRPVSQPLLIPETVRMSPPDFARLTNYADVVRKLGFSIEEFGTDTWKIDAVPQILGGLAAGGVLSSLAADIAEAGPKRGGARGREELIARSVAGAYAGASRQLTPEGAAKLVEELAAAAMPYVCPRGRPTMIFTSNRELDRKFAR